MEMSRTFCKWSQSICNSWHAIRQLKKKYVKGDDWKNYSTEQVEKEKTFVIYLWFTNVSSKLEKRKRAGTFSWPSDNTVRIKFIWIIYQKKELHMEFFSAVSTEL